VVKDIKQFLNIKNPGDLTIDMLVEFSCRNLINIGHPKFELTTNSETCSSIAVEVIKVYYLVHAGSLREVIDYDEYLLKLGKALFAKLPYADLVDGVLYALSHVTGDDCSNDERSLYTGLAVKWKTRKRIIVKILSLLSLSEKKEEYFKDRSVEDYLKNAYFTYRISLYENSLSQESLNSSDYSKRSREFDFDYDEIHQPDISRLNMDSERNAIWILPRKFENEGSALKAIRRFLETRPDIRNVEIILPDGALNQHQNVNKKIKYSFKVNGIDRDIEIIAFNHHDDFRFAIPAVSLSHGCDLKYIFENQLSRHGRILEEKAQKFKDVYRIYSIESMAAIDLDCLFYIVLYESALRDPQRFLDRMDLIIQTSFIVGVLDTFMGSVPPGTQTSMASMLMGFRHTVLGPLGSSEWHQHLNQTYANDPFDAQEQLLDALYKGSRTLEAFFDLCEKVCGDRQERNKMYSKNDSFYDRHLSIPSNYWLDEEWLTGDKYRKLKFDVADIDSASYHLIHHNSASWGYSHILVLVDLLSGHVVSPHLRASLGGFEYDDTEAIFRTWINKYELLERSNRKESIESTGNIINSFHSSRDLESQDEFSSCDGGYEYKTLFPRIDKTCDWLGMEVLFREKCKVFDILYGGKVFKVAYYFGGGNPKYLTMYCTYKGVDLLIPERYGSDNPEYPRNLSMLSLNQNATDISPILQDLVSRVVTLLTNRSKVRNVFGGGSVACGARSAGIPSKADSDFMLTLFETIQDSSKEYCSRVSLKHKTGYLDTREEFCNFVVSRILLSSGKLCFKLRSILFDYH